MACPDVLCNQPYLTCLGPIFSTCQMVAVSVCLPEKQRKRYCNSCIFIHLHFAGGSLPRRIGFFKMFLYIQGQLFPTFAAYSLGKALLSPESSEWLPKLQLKGSLFGFLPHPSFCFFGRRGCRS